ncbi:hypothetical protein [Campylobacter concisus]
MKFMCKVGILACSAVFAFGADVIAKDANITLNGKMIGKIEVLTPVEVVEKGDKTSKIKVSGVVSANYLAQLQRSVEDPEVFVAFDNESEANFKKVKDLEDDYGEVWYQADGVYEVPNDALGGNQKELYAKAKKIYEETCSACHRLHEPNSFTAAQWPANLSGMVDAKFVALDETDLNLVLKYLQHNAKKVK